LRIGVPKESASGERRVALVPEVAKALAAADHEVIVESGAGEGANHPDSAYTDAGATIGDPWEADVVVKVQRPSESEIARTRPGQVVIGFLAPLTAGETTRALAEAGVTSLAMEAVPRITRAQAIDALSSQANVGGYLSVLIAARECGRFFPMMTTAAGTVAPAKVLVLGAGVAGLQAIATAKRLGAVVTAFDVRSVVKEQVESLGARFLEADAVKDAEGEGGYARPLTEEENERLREELAAAVAKQDIVITTAQVPGKPAPVLITADAARGMRTGSMIVDLAGESGGNCELTEPGETVVEDGVKVIAPLNLPGEMAEHASQLYAKNIQNLLELLVGEDGSLALDFGDEIVAGSCITHDGEIRHEGAREAAGAAA
jgi:NAD(P) transhydrogenase subunit alpha